MAIADAFKYLNLTDYTPNINISFDSEDLIQDVENDLLMYPKDEPTKLIIKEFEGHYVFIDYRLANYDDDTTDENITVITTLEKALEVFKLQDSII